MLKNKIYHLFRPLMVHIGAENVIVRMLVHFFMDDTCLRWGKSISFSNGGFEMHSGNKTIRTSLQNWVYGLTICKSFDYYFNAVEPIKVGTRQVIDCSKPRLYTFRISGKEFEASGFPEQEQEFMEYAKLSNPKPGDVVFDIGANCGVSAYWFSKWVGPRGRVVAFEPDPQNFCILKRNIARHGLKNVTAVPIAIAATKGWLDFNSEGTQSSTLVRHSSRLTCGKVVRVKSDMIDNVISIYGVPDIIKLDIEGAEEDSLRQSLPIVASGKFYKPPIFVIDTDHGPNGGTVKPVERILKQHGYKIKSTNNTGFWTTVAKKPEASKSHNR